MFCSLKNIGGSNFLFLPRLQYLHSSSSIVSLKHSRSPASILCSGQHVLMFFLSVWLQKFLICSHLHQGRGCSFSLNGCLQWYHLVFISFRDKAALAPWQILALAPFDSSCSPKPVVSKGIQVSVYSVGGIHLPSNSVKLENIPSFKLITH